MKKREKSDLLEFVENFVIIYFFLSILHFFWEFSKGLFDKDTAAVFWTMIIVVSLVTYFVL